MNVILYLILDFALQLYLPFKMEIINSQSYDTAKWTFGM